MQELAWAAIGRDRIEWDRTVAICVATLSPWIGVAQVFTGSAPELDIDGMHPYRVTKHKKKKDLEATKANWKEFVRMRKEKA